MDWLAVVDLCTYVCVCEQAGSCTLVYMCVCVWVGACVRACVRASVHASVSVFRINVPVCVCMHLCVHAHGHSIYVCLVHACLHCKNILQRVIWLRADMYGCVHAHVFVYAYKHIRIKFL